MPEISMTDPYTELIRCACLAPSGHNTQPWKFHIQGDTIRITADTSRQLPVVDPADRELFISLGCALENLLIAAAHTGFAAQAAVFPDDDPAAIRVRLSPANPVSDPLFDAIPRRQSTRNLYDGQPVPGSILEQLRSLKAEPGISLQLVTPGAEMDTLIQRVVEGDQSQYSDRAFVEELIRWVRFNEAEAARMMDGLSSQCTGNPSTPRWLGALFLRLGGPGWISKADEKKMRTSSGLALFLTESDDRLAWVNTGRAYERFALTATTLGLKMALMNQPVEVPPLRGKLGKDLPLNGAYPQLLVRFGYAEEMPRSLRRPLSQVIAA